MRGLRRAVLAVFIGAVLGLLLRFRGSTTSTPRRGGWRELGGPELR